MAEDEMVRWQHRLNGQEEFEQTPGDSEGQGSLVCYSPWDHRVGHNRVTEQQVFTSLVFFVPSTKPDTTVDV